MPEEQFQLCHLVRHHSPHHSSMLCEVTRNENVLSLNFLYHEGERDLFMCVRKKSGLDICRDGC